jgi:tRNA threonylcarbamoyl adenosine modification protein YjeE
MAAAVLQRSLADERATTLLGADLAMVMRVGDVFLLKGDLGAGKTTLARGLIRALAGDPDLDVPSPTFTLVQAYDTPLPVSHVDLYRLSAPEEIEELGLDDALKTGAVLMEWPERAADRLPGDAITVALADDARAGRTAVISGPDEALARIARSFACHDFLDAAGWEGADRRRFVGDASARSYETVTLAERPLRVLMNSPRPVPGPPVRDGKAYAEIARSARTVSAFVGVAHLLREAGVCVPAILAQDLDRGLLLIEHLGTEPFLSPEGIPLVERYAAAARLLAFIHGRRWSFRAAVAPGVEHVVPPFDRDAMMIELELLLDWYLPFAAERPANPGERAAFGRAWGSALDRLERCETSIVLRDFHSPNIVWRGDKTGHDRLGILDFQDALVGPAAYDVASLALDARVTVPDAIEAATIEAYCDARGGDDGFDRAAFEAAYAIMGAQRNSKILGIFVRLKERDGKPQYLRHLPRIRAYLRKTLRHPALAEVAGFYEQHGILEERTP